MSETVEGVYQTWRDGNESSTETIFSLGKLIDQAFEQRPQDENTAELAKIRLKTVLFNLLSSEDDDDDEEEENEIDSTKGEE